MHVICVDLVSREGNCIVPEVTLGPVGGELRVSKLGEQLTEVLSMLVVATRKHEDIIFVAFHKKSFRNK